MSRTKRAARWLAASVGRVALLVSLLWCNGAPVRASDAVGLSGARLTLLASDQEHIMVELTVGDWEIEQLEVNGEHYHRIHIAATQLTTTPGAPALPMYGALFGLPTTASVKVEVLEADHETLSGYHLPPAPQVQLHHAPSVRNDTVFEQGFDSSEVRAAFALDAALYATDTFYPGEVVQLGETGYVREQAVVQAQFYPVQYNPVRYELHIYRHIKARITWDASATQASIDIARARSPFFEQILQKALVNGDALVSPIATTSADVASNVQTYLPMLHRQQTGGDGPRLKISILEDGIYRITHSDLLAAGMNVTGIDPQTIHLHNRGLEIGIYVAGEADGVFDAADYILFYGTSVSDLYTTTNVYWLSAGGEQGLRMAQRDGAPSSGDAPIFSNFPVTHHVEEDTVYWQNMPGRGEDRWFWQSRISPNTENLPTSRDYSLTLGTVALDATPAVLRIRLKGYTGLSHRTHLALNGQVIDEWEWNGQIQLDRTIQLDHSLLQEGENIVRVEALQSNAPVDQILVNWIEIDYARQYVAADDRLWFGTAQNGVQHYGVSGFGQPDIRLFEVTDRNHPVQIDHGNVLPEGAGFRIDFEADSQLASQYLALTPAQYRLPVSITQDQPSNWQYVGNGADYIIITHAEFSASAHRLADHHRAAGLRVAVVDVQDIYDEFNDGIFHSKAIRDFLQHAYMKWAAPAPTYVLLFGDANQDYRDKLKTGTPNYVPSHNMESDLFGEVSSDNWFVAVRGDDSLPDMFIGRLSAQDRQMAETMVDKIISYDQDRPDPSWNRRVLFVADDDDALFSAISEELMQHIPLGYTVKSVFASNYPPGNPHVELMDAMRQGTILVNYIGHGEYFGWGKWNGEKDFLLQESDIPSLHNRDKLPVVVMGNCLNGFFAGPKDRPALAETLQRQGDGGAVAVWAPTSYGYSSGHRLLLDSFYTSMFVHDQLSLGAATTAAKLATYAQSAFWGELIETYILFGDPATVLGIPINYPYIEQTIPAANASDVPLDQTIQVVFNKPMNPDTVTLTALSASFTFSATWDSSFMRATFTHPSFEYARTYQLSIEGQDRSGNSLRAGPVPTSWSLTTSADQTLPTATITAPRDDPLSLLATTPLEIAFSQPIREESVTYSIHPYVFGTLQWDVDGRRARFSHEPFQTGRSYTYTLLSAVDVYGNALTIPVEFTFTVGSTIYSHLPRIGLSLPETEAN